MALFVVRGGDFSRVEEEDSAGPETARPLHGHPVLVFDYRNQLHVSLTVFAKEAKACLADGTDRTYLNAILPFFTFLEADEWQITAGTKSTVRVFLSGLKLFYRLAQEAGYYAYSNPLVDSVAAAVPDRTERFYHLWSSWILIKPFDLSIMGDGRPSTDRFCPEYGSSWKEPWQHGPGSSHKGKLRGYQAVDCETNNSLEQSPFIPHRN